MSNDPLDCVLNLFWRPHAELSDIECQLESLGIDPQAPESWLREVIAAGVAALSTHPPAVRPQKPDASELSTCDWGYCDDIAVDFRWAEDLSQWLPVCRRHAGSSFADALPARPSAEAVAEYGRKLAEVEAAEQGAALSTHPAPPAAVSTSIPQLPEHLWT